MPIAGKRIEMSDLLKSGLWSAIGAGLAYDMQSSIFQPKGGMGQIGKAFGKALEPLIRYNCKVVEIKQSGKGVQVSYTDSRTGGTPKTMSADWCVCTIPASVLSQIPMNVGGPMKAAINQIPYMAALKVGLQMKRRFWEQDEQIYGGVTYTNQPNTMIGYPQWDFFSKRKGVLLGSYCFGTPAYIAAAKPGRRSASRTRWNTAQRSTRNTRTNLNAAWRWLAPRALDLEVAPAWTEKPRAALRQSLRRHGASLRASMPRAFPPGRKVP